jgi:CheY-like chemotaxis protein
VSPQGLQRTAQVLLVEDDEGDALLTEKALLAGTRPLAIHHVLTGEDALEFLRNTRPDLILLDLNLPGISGREVLQTVKAHKDWRRIPVVILTSSRVDEDILKAHDLYANSYMVKPGDPSIFERLAGSLEDYWFKWSELAPR